METLSALVVAQHALRHQLTASVTSGDLQRVKDILEMDPSMVNLALTRNTPLLVIAVEKVRRLADEDKR